MTSIPLAKPLHDIAIKVMTRNVLSHFVSIANVRAYLPIPRLPPLLLTNTPQLLRSWTRSYENGVASTIVWEIGHSQPYSSLLRWAKMWARRYDGKVQVIVLVKYLCRNPRLRNDAVFVFRPAWSAERNKWIALQDWPPIFIKANKK